MFVAKRAREVIARNQRLESELEQLQKGNSENSVARISEIERRHAEVLQKKSQEVDIFRRQLAEAQLANSCFRDQIEDQNKLIERLENGLKLAMDQIDYLSGQQTGNNDYSNKATNESSSNYGIMDDDDINYDDLDEETLMTLLAQTKMALMEKRHSVGLNLLGEDSL